MRNEVLVTKMADLTDGFLGCTAVILIVEVRHRIII